MPRLERKQQLAGRIGRIRRWPLVVVLLLVGSAVTWMSELVEGVNKIIEAFGPPKGLTRVAVHVLDNSNAIRSFRTEWEQYIQPFIPNGTVADGLDGFAVVDVMLRNTRESAAVVHRLHIKFFRVSPKPERLSAGCAGFGPSWIYHVKVEHPDSGHTVTQNAALEVEGHRALRFAFIIANFGETARSEYDVHLMAEFNQTESMDLGTHRVRFPPSPCILGPRQIDRPILLAESRSF